MLRVESGGFPIPKDLASGDDVYMQDTTYSSSPYTTSTAPNAPLRRLAGPVGGVAAGLAHRFELNPTLVRIGIATATVMTGPVALVAYLVAWMVMPIDPSVPVSDRPSKVPPMLIGAVALLLGLGLVIDIVTAIPTSVIVVGAIAAWYFWNKNR